MKLIGRVADNSTETSARLILLKDLEKSLVAEELVLIKNGGEQEPTNKILGVLREGLGKNEFLSHTTYRPDVAFMKYGGEPSSAREVYSFSIRPIGSVNDSGLEPNRSIIQPRSPVYLLEDSDKPLEWIAQGKDCIWLDAYLDRHESWKIPVDKTFIPYHVAVYGSTGSGKSWLTRYVLVPLYMRAGYRVLILDWSGTDYSPIFKEDKKVGINSIALDEESIFSYIKDKTDDFASNRNLSDAFDEAISGWSELVKGSQDHEELYNNLMGKVDGYINAIDRNDYKRAAQRTLGRVKRKLTSQDLIPVMGRLEIEQILNELKDLLVIDMSGVTSEAKLGFFLALSRYLYEEMESGKDLNLALVIDEAPQYAPWDPKGLQGETTEMIKNIAALGRKRKLSLTLIAQGIKGDIGINASVRRNLNTQFFGRIHPLDAGGEGGASEWLSPYGITSDTLLQLKPGKFYFAGAMNPSPVPLLVTYKAG